MKREFPENPLVFPPWNRYNKRADAAHGAAAALPLRLEKDMLHWDMQSFIVTLIVLMTSMPVHECAHAWAAYKLGDDTASLQGRLNLNPLAHLDPVGSIMLLLTQRFGWAKPTPVDPRNFTRKITMRGGMAITALAGPVSNLLLGFVLLLVNKAAVLALGCAGQTEAAVIVSYILLMMVTINVSLAVFNLLPMPPLDGYRILSYFIPSKWEYQIAKYQQVIYVVVLAAVFLGVLNVPLGYLTRSILQFFALITQTPELLYV